MKTKLFITLGPSTINKKFLSGIDKKYIKLLRINLSHTDLCDLPKLVKYIRKYSNIDICFDSEGAQIRTSKLKGDIKKLHTNKIIKINKNNNVNNNITIVPRSIYKNLRKGDVLSIDFNSVVVKIIREDDKVFECKILQGDTKECRSPGCR